MQFTFRNPFFRIRFSTSVNDDPCTFTWCLLLLSSDHSIISETILIFVYAFFCFRVSSIAFFVSLHTTVSLENILYNDNTVAGRVQAHGTFYFCNFYYRARLTYILKIHEQWSTRFTQLTPNVTTNYIKLAVKRMRILPYKNRTVRTFDDIIRSYLIIFYSFIKNGHAHSNFFASLARLRPSCPVVMYYLLFVSLCYGKRKRKTIGGGRQTTNLPLAAFIAVIVDGMICVMIV